MRLSIVQPRAGNDNPCPQANGTNIGTFQQFTLLCGQDLRGDTINRTDAGSFLACVDTCSSFHPKCEGVAFNRRGCELKANLRGGFGGPSRDSRFQDAAMAQFPTASSNCASLGSSTSSGTTNFNVFCGNIVNGNDISQSFAATFQDCLSQCTSQSGCGGVSFDASMSLGFKNCYMKGAASASSPIVDTGIDTAIVGNAAAADPAPAPAPSSSASQSPVSASNAPSPSPSSSSDDNSPAAPSTPATSFATTTLPPSTTTVSVSADPVTVTAAPAPASSAAPATSSAAAPATSSLVLSFSTVQGTPTAVLPETSVLTQTVLSVITSVGESATQVLTVPVTITPFGMETTSSINPAAATEGAAVVGIPGSDAKAWIAAPVVGSIAAVTVIAAAFVMWGKRRTSRGGSSIGSGGGGGGGGVGGWFSRLPFMSSRSDLGSMRERSGSRGGLTLPFGNYWRLGATKLADEESSRGGNSGLPSRSGVVTRENTPQYEVKQGKMALRDSLNGLAQNRSTLDGIPGFLRE